MDDPGIDRGDLEKALGYIRAVNRRLGGTRALLRHLEAWSRRWPGGRPVTMLDIGTGSADIPLEVRAWGERAGHDIRVTAVDLHASTTDIARRRVVQAGARGVSVERLDAFSILDRYGRGSFDYVHAGMFLHHLRDPDAERMLGLMAEAARAGVVWNDLVRSRVALGAIHVLSLGQGRTIRHDAVASVRKGFTKAEAEAMRDRLGLSFLTWRSSFLTQRFTLAGEKADAW